MNRKQKIMLFRILLSAALTALLVIFEKTGLFTDPRWALLLCYLVPYGIVSYDVLRKAVKGIIRFRPFDENFLMAVATVGAFALAMIGNGDFLEAVAVMLFYQTGELFQSVAVGKSRRNIAALMDIRPDSANLELADGTTVAKDPAEVAPGSVIVVRPGEKIPLDGVVLEGSSTVDTAALTGESLPREVEPGGEVISGTVNLSGVLRVETTKEFGESTVSKILDMVENASSKKSRSEAFIAKFAKYYTPAVCFSALALALLPPLFLLLFTERSPAFTVWLYRALTFLVISCPCALVISIPLSFFAGIGGASRLGVLVKGANDFESLAAVRTLVFDKTGTMTAGVFEVAGVHHGTVPDAMLIEYAALAESFSTHPISKSLIAAYGQTPDQTRVRDVEEIGGQGITALVDGHSVAVGNDKLMTRLGIAFCPCSHVGTVVHVAIDGVYGGHILICDTIRPHAREALVALGRLGIKKTVMLTGDAAAVGQAVAGQLGISEVHAELLPQDKVSCLEALLSSADRQGKVAFVGDGINDAPVLTRADVGIAMGALGSDAAIAAADVVLMDDDLMKLPPAVSLARKCMRIVKENIAFAIGVKLLCLVLGACGIANLWMAIFADVGVMILAVLNAIRTLHTGAKK